MSESRRDMAPMDKGKMSDINKSVKYTDEEYMEELLLDMPEGYKWTYIPKDKDEIPKNND